MGNCLGTDVHVGTKAGHLNNFSSIGESEQAVAAVYGALGYSTWVQVHVSCHKLKDVDTFSKSDPMVLFLKETGPGGEWKEAGRTECVKNDLSPRFAKVFRTLYNFETVQRFRVLVVDLNLGQNAETVQPHECNLLGQAEFSLSELLVSTARQLTRGLYEPKTGVPAKGSVTLSVEELPNANELLHFQVVGRNLTNKDTFSKSDPFLQISRALGDGDAVVPVLRTETKNNNLNPAWEPIKVSCAQLCNGDWYQRIVLEAYDYNSNGKHALIGSATCSVKQLRELAGTGSSLTLKTPGTNAAQGALLVSSFTAIPQPSFLDYVAGGMEINIVVAVDFTSSNGEVTSPESLHHINHHTGCTPYELAISGVGQVIEFYDSDKMFPAYGFGGRRRGEATNHCFPLNGSYDNPFNTGVSGVLQAYRQALQTHILSGPTLFTPVIDAVAALAAQPTAHLRYTCLLILTDGNMDDMPETVDAIIRASNLPMSILIVGIGSSDFSKMVMLDGDKRRLTQNGQTAARDIVQFVEFKKFQNDGRALAAELLRELPGQVTGYMRSNNILPPQQLAPQRPPAVTP